MNELTRSFSKIYQDRILATFLALSMCALLLVAGRTLESFVERPHIKRLDVATEIFWRDWSSRLLTLHHKAFAADWIWLDFLQRSVEHSRSPESREWEYASLDLASRLDPYFFNLYAAGAPLLNVTQDDVAGAEQLLKKGIEVFENRRIEVDSFRRDGGWRDRFWWLVMNLGYLYLFEMTDIDRAAAAFSSLNDKVEAPVYVKQLSERLRNPETRISVGLGILDLLLSQTRDSRVQERLLEKRQEWLRRKEQDRD